MPVNATDDFAPRRIVTGIGADGRSTVMIEDRVTLSSYGPIAAGAVWSAERMPAPDTGDTDTATRGPAFMTPGAAGFTVFRIPEGDPQTPPAMVSIATIDCIVMLSGRAELFLETGSIEVGAGDLIVDRGVPHGWRAIGDEPAYSVVVNLPADRQR